MIKSYLIIIAYLIVGLIVITMVQLFETPSWINSSFIVLLLFVIVNIITVKIFKLKSVIGIFWSIKKIYFLPIGMIIGGIISVIPVLIGVLTTKITLNELTFNTPFTLSSILITFLIVSWEELWFRGVFLNQCNKKLSTINISITIGMLFTLVHLLNPQINLLKTGPSLFFAGALLTIVYFYFKTIWLPIGLHFGNNYFTINSDLKNHWILGNEGYFGAILLALLLLLFIRLTHKNEVLR